MIAFARLCNPNVTTIKHVKYQLPLRYSMIVTFFYCNKWAFWIYFACKLCVINTLKMSNRNNVRNQYEFWKYNEQKWISCFTLKIVCHHISHPHTSNEANGNCWMRNCFDWLLWCSAKIVEMIASITIH